MLNPSFPGAHQSHCQAGSPDCLACLSKTLFDGEPVPESAKTTQQPTKTCGSPCISSRSTNQSNPPLHLRSSPIISIFFGASPITSILFHPIPFSQTHPNHPVTGPSTLAQFEFPSGSQWFPALHAEAVTHTLAALDVSSISGEGGRRHRHWERVIADFFLSQGPNSRRVKARRLLGRLTLQSWHSCKGCKPSIHLVLRVENSQNQTILAHG